MGDGHCQESAPSAGERADVDRRAIDVDDDGAVPIGPEHVGAGGSVAVDHRRRGMAEAIRAANAHDGHTRRGRAHEGGAARRQAPVMRRADDPERHGRQGRRERPLGFPPDVPCQQHRHGAPAELDHQRIVVAHLLALPVGRGRMPHDQVDAVHDTPVAPHDGGPGNAERSRLGAKGRERLVARHGDPLPHLARAELPEDRREAAHVIGVAVGHHRVVEPPDPCLTQYRRDDAVAKVEEGAGGRTARVDEKRRATGEPDEHGVSLPDIDERHAKPAVAPATHQNRRLDQDPDPRTHGDQGAKSAAQARPRRFGATVPTPSQPS